MPLHEALFVETNPGPVKYAVSRLGLCKPDTRLPLAPISDQAKALVDLALEKAGLFKRQAA
jgi:4-hydroxy-tetrahydrodipicolinate synthase